jgi:hypothetical protein
LQGDNAGTYIYRRYDESGEDIVDDLSDPQFERMALAGINADGAYIHNVEAAGVLGRQFASILGGSLRIEDPFARVAASGLIATVGGENLAEAIKNGGISAKLPTYDLFSETYNVLENVIPEFAANVASAGIGAISSMLVADLVDSWTSAPVTSPPSSPTCTISLTIR